MEAVKSRIILVDDNPSNLRTGKNVLSEKFAVFTAPSAAKLFELLSDVKPAMILLDIEMPEMSGYEAITMLKAKDETRDIPVMFLERWDGKGYPKGLAGEEIPLQGRIMALADVYDALTAERPYKKAFTHEESIKIMAEGRGTQFDPALTGVFLAVMER
ncbi:MAG: response regulator [Treponema sp.]|jgi:response regulator RpfG family c-di-GMP phosphodiesterase|nr:response regulator [Treponema sp.]